ncbi:MAG: HU family DNA-binding protein [Alphaproteobacteria bacterium]|nr:HU family DNA-binding protein [Alphaproteobacteria bacterium]
MSWTELVRAVSERAGVNQNTTRAVLVALVEVARERLASGDSVALRGLGTLERRWSKGRVVRGISDKRRMWIGGHFVPRFKPSTTLREALASDESWRSETHQRAWRLAETLIDDLDLYHKGLAPSGIASDLAPEAVEERCAEAFGSHWDQVSRTWHQSVGKEVDTHFLGLVARRRWA